MLMNMFKKMNSKIIKFYFLITERDGEDQYESLIKSLGGVVIKLPKYNVFNHFSYKTKFDDVLIKYKIDILHAHSLFPAYIYMKLAKKRGVKIISHAHNQSGLYGPLKELLFKYNKNKFLPYTDIRLSCSLESGIYIYGKSKYKWSIFNNSINVEKFRYNKSYKKQIRSELNIPENAFVMGHVGSFSKVKNHRYLIDIMKSLPKNNLYMILVGDGELKEDIVKYSKKSNVFKRVKFLGSRKDVYKILSSIDLFLLPSLSEGFPLVTIEAQASGLPIISTHNIDTNVKINENVTFIDIREKQKWIDNIKFYREAKVDRASVNNNIYKFDSKNAAKEIVELYKCLNEITVNKSSK